MLDLHFATFRIERKSTLKFTQHNQSMEGDSKSFKILWIRTQLTTHILIIIHIVHDSSYEISNSSINKPKPSGFLFLHLSLMKAFTSLSDLSSYFGNTRLASAKQTILSII